MELTDRVIETNKFLVKYLDVLLSENKALKKEIRQMKKEQRLFNDPIKIIKRMIPAN